MHNIHVINYLQALYISPYMMWGGGSEDGDGGSVEDVNENIGDDEIFKVQQFKSFN